MRQNFCIGTENKFMKQFSPLVLLFVLLAVTLNSCEVIGDILEVGIWMGLIVAALVIGLVIWLVRKFRR